MKFKFHNIDKAGFIRIWNSDFNDGFPDSPKASFEETDFENWNYYFKKRTKVMREVEFLDQIIGYIFLSPKEDGSAHLGYGLYRQYRGKGYSIEMCKQFLKIEIPKLDSDITKILGTTLNVNTASQIVLKRLGFKLIGKLENVEFEYLRYERYRNEF